MELEKEKEKEKEKKKTYIPLDWSFTQNTGLPIPIISLTDEQQDNIYRLMHINAFQTDICKELLTHPPLRPVQRGAPAE